MQWNTQVTAPTNTAADGSELEGEGGQQHCATDGNGNSLLDGKNSELGTGKVVVGCQHILVKVGHAQVKKMP